MTRAFFAFLLLLLPGRLAAQAWNDAPVRQLVRRAILLRETPATDSTLGHYRSRAHGFVFLLAQFGRGFPDPPRLAKADELDVEVYWESPDRSKQRIVAWRDDTFLPSTMRYHRDHLGIVTNNYGPRIRIGEGDEVRDAIHPLSIEGLDEYDFALGDTITLRTNKGPIEVLGVQVRPREVSRPLVVGTLYLERSTAALVRFQFSFTPAAYRDTELEDISVVLEQSLFEEKWWLPYRQTIEIRRSSSVFDFPARWIIQAKWDIEDYDFSVPFPELLREAEEFGGLAAPVPDTLRWKTPLRTAAEAADPFDRREFDELKGRAEELVSGRILQGLPRGRFGTTSVSELIRVNRVQGLAFGVGAGLRFDGGYEFRGTLGYGLADHRITAGLRAGVTRGGSQWSLEARRTIRDFGDEPVVSGAVNSLLSQEAAIDLGSYLLGEEIGIGLTRRLDARWTLGLAARFERSSSLVTKATPVRGAYQPNPSLGSGSYWLGRALFSLAPRGAVDRADLKAYFAVEAGTGESQYIRAAFRSDGTLPIGLGHVRLRTILGAASGGLPKSRSFAIGGRGTLPGETFRAYGGKQVASAQFEWRIGVPVPAIGLGPFATTGRRAILAPFVGIGWAGGEMEGVDWRTSRGSRPVVGVALELLQNLLRLELATVLRDRNLLVGDQRPRRKLRLTVDIAPEWWPIL